MIFSFRKSKSSGVSNRSVTQKVHVRTTWQHIQYWMLVMLFVASIWYFWSWWLLPEHYGQLTLYALMTGALAYQFTVLPCFYTFFLGWMRKPVHSEPQSGMSVAMITLTVPGSESLDIVERQLNAMAQVRYPHDSWLLVDKEHSPEIEALAAKFGVRYFSRHDVETWGRSQVDRWNDVCPPFKAKTKAGNVNAWLDAIEIMGIEYDYFTQLDVDHVPSELYLDRVLGYFRDSNVAWVQAPSVYSNLSHWTARGSAEQELVLQGPLQSGFFGFSQTPFIIGSHCTYDMNAIKRIGGFQPTRAEDHLDTVVLAAHGYRGVFVPETIAFGDGPENIEMYLGQQFAWAYSMIQVLFKYTPKMMIDYTFRQAGQFLFAQTWYVMWSISLAVLFALPSVALLTDQSISHTGYVDFLQHSIPQAALATIIWWWSSRWFQPQGLRLSWRGIILHIARWPIVLSALIQVILRVEKPYMITRKGVDIGHNRPFLIRTHIPFFVLIMAPLGVCWFYIENTGRSSTQGYLLYALQGALGVFLVYATALVQDVRQLMSEVGVIRSLRLRVRALSVCICLLLSITLVGCVSAGRIKEAVTASPSVAVIVSPTAELGNSDSTVTVPVPSPLATATPEPSVTTTRETPTPTESMENVVQLPEGRMFLGIYDVWTKGFEDRELDVELNFFDWTDSVQIEQFIEESLNKERVPMISVEPFTTHSGDDSRLLQETIAGANDSFIRENAQAIKRMGDQLIIVRFAHEMELVGNYPWSTDDQDLAIQFYRHYVDLFRQEGVENVRWVWSPAGNPEAPSYYPGDEYVDYIGLTILGNRAWDLEHGDHVNSFSELLTEKYERVAPFGKPIILAELGVAGEPDHKRTWLADAHDALADYPLLIGVIYFNSYNAENAWKGDTPDWRISSDMLWEPDGMPVR